jgi:hypothetical protein
MVSPWSAQRPAARASSWHVEQARSLRVRGAVRSDEAAVETSVRRRIADAPTRAWPKRVAGRVAGLPCGRRQPTLAESWPNLAATEARSMEGATRGETLSRDEAES